MIIFYLCEFIIICIGLYFSYYRSNYPIHMLQLEGYDNKEYKNWIRENKDHVSKFFYSKNYKSKTPLVWTDRAKRLLKTHKLVNVICFLIGAIITDIIYENTKSYLSLIGLIIFLLLIYYFQYVLLLISNAIRKPKEEKINLGFYLQAQEKIKTLKKESGLKVLGITGSFGKTSVKFISDTILKEKYRTKNTPSSFNTPMGLSKVINNELDKNHEVFIAELGAKQKGEIDEVAKLVSPDIGIITAVGPTHMHLFKTIENIQNTKYELIEDLPEDGIAIFNYDNDYVKPLADKTKKKTYRYGIKDIEKLDVYAKDIRVNEKGSTFTLGIKGLGEISCSSVLLGIHNISNLLAGASAAYVLGLNLEQIKNGIEKVKAVEHRLNIVPSPAGYVVIDDAFNSNPVGFRAALSVIDEFKEGKKIIITPGMVELGAIEEEENYKIGIEIAKVCDYVILVGQKISAPIKRALIDNNFNEDRIFTVKSLNDGTSKLVEIAKAGDVVLFENDLPDNYNEEWFYV